MEQNAETVRGILGKTAVLEHHSNLILEDGLETYRLLTERWEAPVVFTTLVQFLDALFAGRTQAVRRLHQLKDAVIIFDEVQGVPVKCIHLFNGAVRFLSDFCGATVVLCTATQPELQQVAFPLPRTEQMLPESRLQWDAFCRTRVEVVETPFRTETLADFVRERLEEVRSVLVVCNTRTAARKLYQALADTPDVRVLHLSGSMYGTHRLSVLRTLRGLLEGGGTKVVCVSTQLIEAGVDLSVECVVRSMAGLDRLAQSAGRCNRNGEDACRTVYLVYNAAENLQNLPEIREAQDACKRVLLDWHGREEDLLAPDAMAQYYRYYFYGQGWKMDYPVFLKQPGTLLDLLSENAMGGESPLLMRQAFRTAGGLFRVLERDTTAALVLDAAGKRKWDALCRAKTLAQQQEALRACRRYAVDLYDWEKARLQLQGGLKYREAVGLWTLEGACYHEAYGVAVNGTEARG